MEATEKQRMRQEIKAQRLNLLQQLEQAKTKYEKIEIGMHLEKLSSIAKSKQKIPYSQVPPCGQLTYIDYIWYNQEGWTDGKIVKKFEELTRDKLIAWKRVNNITEDQWADEPFTKKKVLTEKDALEVIREVSELRSNGVVYVKDFLDYDITRFKASKLIITLLEKGVIEKATAIRMEGIKRVEREGVKLTEKALSDKVLS